MGVARWVVHATGNVNEKILPWPCSLSTLICPPWASTSARVIKTQTDALRAMRARCTIKSFK